MTSFIMIIVIALFIVQIGFTIYRAEAYERIEKVVICVAGTLISWLITIILFNLSSKGIEYSNLEFKHQVSKILVLVFTSINGIIYMPYIVKLMSKYKFNEIKNDELIKKILLLIIITIILFTIEVIYLKNIQLGIINVANKM